MLGRSTYAVLDLGGRGAVLASALDRNPLLAVYRLAGNEVGSREQILLAAASDEDTLVTMGLDDDLLAALRARAALAAAAAATTASAISMPNVFCEEIGTPYPPRPPRPPPPPRPRPPGAPPRPKTILLAMASRHG